MLSNYCRLDLRLLIYDKQSKRIESYNTIYNKNGDVCCVMLEPDPNG